MEVEFECDCGHEISEFTRGGVTKNVQLECPNCRAVWTLTLTNIRSGEPRM
ncbi:MAG: hypothetical protein V5A17_14560 [Natronomonas sp.]